MFASCGIVALLKENTFARGEQVIVKGRSGKHDIMAPASRNLS